MRITKDFVDERIDTLLVDMSRGTQPNPKPFAFRCSGLPFCGIRAFAGADPYTDSFSMEFYTTIGTAVHENIQKWITRGNLANRVWARWKCSECSVITGPGFRPDHCPACGCTDPTFGYEEVEIEYRGLGGHVDLIYEIHPGSFVIVDFKTTNLSKSQQRPDWRNWYPASPSSVVQIGAYSTLLRTVYRLNIVAWCLVYVDRGKVISGPRDYHKVTRPWSPRKHKHMKRLLDRACDHNATLRELQTAIAHADDYSTDAVDLLKQLVRQRPCVDEDSYDGWMRYKFHPASKEERVCKYKGECTAGSRAIYQRLMREITGEPAPRRTTR